MAMRYSFLFGVSRILTRQTYNVCQKHHATTAIFPVPSKNKTISKKLAIEHDDPDVFGTLSLRENLGTQKLDSIKNHDNFIDEGDAIEEKFLSFEPADKKSSEQFELEIEQLINDRNLKEALFRLEVTMKEDKVRPSRSIFSLLIGACGRAGYTKKAFNLFNVMKKRGCVPADSHYTALFNSCANSPWKEDGLQRATMLRQQLKDKNVILNRAQYHAMIKAFGHCGEIGTTLEIMDEMATNQITVTTESFNFLLHACISLPEEGFTRAILIWRRLRNMRVTPSIFSYNLMLRAARDCGAKDMDGKHQPIESMLLLEEKTGSQSNNPFNPAVLTMSELTTVTNQLTVCPNFLAEKIQSSNVMGLAGLDRTENRLALLGGIEGFLAEMSKDHVKPDIKTFALLLETIASDPSEEKKLMEQMKAFGVIPDVTFLNVFIKKRQFRRDNSGAQEVLNYFQEYQLFPNIMTFGVLATGCRSSQEAGALMKDMENAGFRVNIEIFGSFLKNAIFHKKCYFIMDLLKRATEMNLTLDEKAIKLLDKFRRETKEAIAKHDRGLEVPKIYGNEWFRESFRVFCLGYKPQMEKLEVALEPHPWQQYRYPLAKKDKTDQTSYPSKSGKVYKIKNKYFDK